VINGTEGLWYQRRAAVTITLVRRVRMGKTMKAAHHTQLAKIQRNSEERRRRLKR